MLESKERQILKQTARGYHIPRQEMERDMREAIEAAFNNPNPEVQRRLKALFPDSPPKPENFIQVVAQLIQQEQRGRNA